MVRHSVAQFARQGVVIVVAHIQKTWLLSGYLLQPLAPLGGDKLHRESSHHLMNEFGYTCCRHSPFDGLSAGVSQRRLHRCTLAFLWIIQEVQREIKPS